MESGFNKEENVFMGSVEFVESRKEKPQIEEKKEIKDKKVTK